MQSLFQELMPRYNDRRVGVSGVILIMLLKKIISCRLRCRIWRHKLIFGGVHLVF